MATFTLKCSRCGVTLVGRASKSLRSKWVCPTCRKRRQSPEADKLLNRKRW